MTRGLLVVLAACGSTPPPAPPINNVAPTQDPTAATSPCGLVNFTNRHAGALYGATCDPQVREWLPGVTVLVTGPNLSGDLMVISDDNGVFGLAVPPGDYTVTYYFSDCTWLRHHHVGGADTPPIYDPLIQKDCK